MLRVSWGIFVSGRRFLRSDDPSYKSAEEVRWVVITKRGERERQGGGSRWRGEKGEGRGWVVRDVKGERMAGS